MVSLAHTKQAPNDGVSSLICPHCSPGSTQKAAPWAAAYLKLWGSSCLLIQLVSLSCCGSCAHPRSDRWENYQTIRLNITSVVDNWISLRDQINCLVQRLKMFKNISRSERPFLSDTWFSQKLSLTLRSQLLVSSMFQARETDLNPGLPSNATTLAPCLVLPRITGVKERRRSTSILLQKPFRSDFSDQLMPILNTQEVCTISSMIVSTMKVKWILWSYIW